MATVVYAKKDLTTVNCELGAIARPRRDAIGVEGAIWRRRSRLKRNAKQTAIEIRLKSGRCALINLARCAFFKKMRKYHAYPSVEAKIRF
jgi:hypothetical protein